MESEVLEFIQRRFTNDCHWNDGNCYYFAVILKDRFHGDIYYDVVYGHFATMIGGILYDWHGVVNDFDRKMCFVEWSKFDNYDAIQKERIIRDCVM